MRKIYLVIIAVLFTLFANTQDIARNNIYLELGGPAYLYSVNYEHLLSSNKDLNFPIRIGIFYNFTRYSANTLYYIPFSISIIKKMNGDYKMYFELKALTTLAFYRKFRSLGAAHGGYHYITHQFIPGLSFGIRRQAPNGGFYYHINMQISYDKEASDNIIMWPALGIGNTF